jgi:putative spermidine/putrescine transport system permease protein
MISAIRRSLLLALATMVITTVLATALAIAYRREFRGKRALLFLAILGIITPGITYGIGATLFLNEILGLPKDLWLALTVHVVWTLPFSFIVLLAGFPPTLAQNERAARVMGADTLTVFREIVFPQIAPSVLGAAVFAFTLSYNEATRGLLIIGRDNTMPIEVFAIASARRPTPELFALGSITTVISTILLVIAGLVVYRASRRGGLGDEE